MNNHHDAEHHSGPAEVAQLLHKEFQYDVEGPGNSPDLLALQRFFELLFFASLHTDELQPILFKTVCIDPDNPEPDPPQIIRADRRTCAPFKDRVPLNVKRLVKLSRATHPTSSAIAVWHDQGGWFAWGLVDQEWGRHTFIHREGGGYYGRCGLFEAIVSGAGSIEVFDDLRLVCALRHGRMVRDQHDVFRAGPVSDHISRYIGPWEAEVRDTVSRGTLTHSQSLIVDTSKRRCVWPHIEWNSELAQAMLANQHLREALAWHWVTFLCRLLLSIQRQKHGGGVLIVPNGTTEGLDVSHAIQYDRLRRVMSATSIMSYFSAIATQDLARQIYKEQEDDCERATTGCIRFIASMSCMDGVILLDDKLTVHGFGVEIRVANELSTIYLARDAMASPESLQETSCERYGTRHRSVMRYCKANPKALGFVVSQDGDIRAIACVESKIVMWEDIRVHLSYTTGPQSIRRSDG